jgi:excisionase family DNA binding protein
MTSTTYVHSSLLRSPESLRLGLLGGYTRAKVGDQQPTAEADGHNTGSPQLLTVAEACAELRISKWSLYQLIRSRQLVTIKIGSRRVVPMTALQALITRLQAEEAT